MFIEKTYIVDNKYISLDTCEQYTKTQLYFINVDANKKLLVHAFNLDTHVLINKAKKSITIKIFKKNKPFFNTFKKVLQNAIEDFVDTYSRIFTLYSVHFPARYSLNKDLEILNFRGNKTSIKIKKKEYIDLCILQNHRLKVTALSRVHVLNYFEQIRQKLKPLGDSRIFIDTIVLEPL